MSFKALHLILSFVRLLLQNMEEIENPMYLSTFLPVCINLMLSFEMLLIFKDV